jgi:hypothetical protein
LAEHPTPKRDRTRRRAIRPPSTDRAPPLGGRALAANPGKLIQIDLFRDNAAVATDVAKLTGIQTVDETGPPTALAIHVNEEDWICLPRSSTADEIILIRS